MTTPEIISKELPPEIKRSIRLWESFVSTGIHETELAKCRTELQQVQREAILRAFEAVKVKAEESYERDPCSSEFEPNLMEALDQVTAELKELE